MSQQIKGEIYYLIANIRHSFIVFWSSLLALLLVIVVSTFLFPDSVVSFELSAPHYAFAAVIRYWSVNTAVPYSIKMASTRKNIFLSFGIYALILALANAVLSNTINNLVT